MLEEEEHAIKRNAPIIARLKGYCANSDGYDMVSPSGEGAIRCMREAIETYGSEIDILTLMAQALLLEILLNLVQ